MGEDFYARLAAPKEEPPLGERHIHFMMRANTKKLWVVRSRRSPLCGTPRCRIVRIEECPSTNTSA